MTKKWEQESGEAYSLIVRGWGGVGWGMGESLGCYGSICYTLPCPNFSLLKAPTRCYFTATEPEALELPPPPLRSFSETEPEIPTPFKTLKS